MKVSVFARRWQTFYRQAPAGLLPRSRPACTSRASREHYGYFKAPRGGGSGLVRSLTRRLSSIKGMATRNSKPDTRDSQSVCV
eukprot:scaffold35061_cov63-Phaeocystis_antarctica.AAC.1